MNWSSEHSLRGNRKRSNRRSNWRSPKRRSTCGCKTCWNGEFEVLMVADLLALSDEKLLATPNCGPKVIESIDLALAALGLSRAGKTKSEQPPAEQSEI